MLQADYLENVFPAEYLKKHEAVEATVHHQPQRDGRHVTAWAFPAALTVAALLLLVTLPLLAALQLPLLSSLPGEERRQLPMLTCSSQRAALLLRIAPGAVGTTLLTTGSPQDSIQFSVSCFQQHATVLMCF